MKSLTFGLGLLKVNVITGHKCNKSHLWTQIKGNITFENLLVQGKDPAGGGLLDQYKTEWATLLTKIWVEVSRWGFETLTLFRAKNS